MPKESVDISRQWANEVCREIERDSKMLEFWLRAVVDSEKRTDKQNMERWGRTHIEVEMIIQDFIEIPLKTPPV